MTIREYNDAADRQIIIELLRLNTPQYFAKEEEDDLIYYFDNHAHDYFVAEIGGQVVGSGGFNLTDDKHIGKISWDIIHPDFQRKGIGLQLLRFRIMRIKKIVSIVSISVRTSQHAYLFYEKSGFKLKEVVKDYWAKGFDLYLLDCNINRITIDV